MRPHQSTGPSLQDPWTWRDPSLSFDLHQTGETGGGVSPVLVWTNQLLLDRVHHEGASVHVSTQTGYNTALVNGGDWLGTRRTGCCPGPVAQAAGPSCGSNMEPGFKPHRFRLFPRSRTLSRPKLGPQNAAWAPPGCVGASRRAAAAGRGSRPHRG